VRDILAIPYWTPNGFPALTLDIYEPSATAERPSGGFPLVVYIHGGGWIGGDSRANSPFVDFPAVLASLAARGYVVASINYQFSGVAKYPAQAQDVKAAIRFLRLRAIEYDLDPTRAMTWGVSAGGQLSGIADVTCQAPELAPPKSATSGSASFKLDEIADATVSDCIQGAVAWYGVFDMATIADQARSDGAMSRDTRGAPEWELLGCFRDQCSTEQVRLASPVSFVNRATPPMLLIVGDSDTTVPYQQTTEMAARLKAVGVRHELIVMPGINHCMMGKSPDQTRDANLVALAATFRFIDQTIGTAAQQRPHFPGPGSAIQQ
jgi:acetyl esterase/lipase